MLSLVVITIIYVSCECFCWPFLRSLLGDVEEGRGRYGNIINSNDDDDDEEEEEENSEILIQNNTKFMEMLDMIIRVIEEKREYKKL